MLLIVVLYGSSQNIELSGLSFVQFLYSHKRCQHAKYNASILTSLESTAAYMMSIQPLKVA